MLEVVSLKEGGWSSYRGVQFNGERMVMLRRWSVQWRENDHVREAASLIEGEWSCYGGGQFKGGRMVLQRWSV